MCLGVAGCIGAVSEGGRAQASAGVDAGARAAGGGGGGGGGDGSAYAAALAIAADGMTLFGNAALMDPSWRLGDQGSRQLANPSRSHHALPRSTLDF